MSRLFSKFSKKSPLEVYRFISNVETLLDRTEGRFPSSLEVHRFISNVKKVYGRGYTGSPSPLEVDRFISKVIFIGSVRRSVVSVPSRGK